MGGESLGNTELPVPVDVQSQAGVVWEWEYAAGEILVPSGVAQGDVEVSNQDRLLV